MVLFFSVSRLEKEVIVEESNGGGGGSVEDEDDYFGESVASRSTGEGEEEGQGGTSHGGDGGGGGDSKAAGNTTSALGDVTDSLLRIKQDLLADLTGRVGVRRTTTISSRGAFHAAFVLLALAASGALLLCDLVFTALFYSHHLVRTACDVLESVEESGGRWRESGSSGGTLFFNALHHSNDRRSLRIMLNAFNATRLAIALPFFVLAVHAVSSVKEEYAAPNQGSEGNESRQNSQQLL